MDIEELAFEVRSIAKSVQALTLEGHEQKEKIDQLIEGIRLLSQSRQHQRDVAANGEKIEALFQEILSEVRAHGNNT